MPVNWNINADRDLFLCIIDAYERGLKSLPWQKISDDMKTRGYNFAAEGCRQHYQKLRRESKSATSNNANGPSSSPPKKRSAGNSSSKAVSSKDKNTETAQDSDDSEDIPTSTPSKKAKTEAKKEKIEDNLAYQFKFEDSEGIIDLERDDLYE